MQRDFNVKYSHHDWGDETLDGALGYDCMVKKRDSQTFDLTIYSMYSLFRVKLNVLLCRNQILFIKNPLYTALS